MSSGATSSAGRAKKDGGGCWEGVVAMEVAFGGWVEAIRLVRDSLTAGKPLRPEMKTVLKAYLYASIAMTTTAVAACFVWYKQEYDLAFKLDKSGEIQRAEIHHANSLWLGLWGGIYGLTGVTAAATLLKDGSKE